MPSAAGLLEAREIVAGAGMWAARDDHSRSHLLLRVPDGAIAPTTTLHGVTASVTRHRIEGADLDCLDLTCSDPSVVDTFAALCADALAAIEGIRESQRPAAVSSVLAKWRWFFGAETNPLSRIEAVGLFGELWYLVRHAGVTAESLAAWDASNGARHDFQWPDRSVEVKTTSKSGPAVHRIQHLEQLEDPETGHLVLYSLKISEDRLAANSILSLARRIVNEFAASPDLVDEFERKLAIRGFTPGSVGEGAVPYRVVEEALYGVDTDFPRLTRVSFQPRGIPSGVGRVSYDLSMAACEGWRLRADAADPSGES